MAQYFQVLSQSEKPTPEELRQFYPNIVENQTQTIQYVVRPDEQSFSGPQIFVASDRLMVVDGQSQQVITDQSQASFQNQQYVLQGVNLELQEGSKQVYFVDENGTRGKEPAQAERPIVLNRQVEGSSVVTQLTGSSIQKVITAPLQNQMSQIQQQEQPPVPVPVQQSPARQIAIHSRPPLQTQVQRSTHLGQQKTPNTSPMTPRGGGSSRGRRTVGDLPGLHDTQPPIQDEQISEADNHEAVALDDGSVVSLASFKQMMAKKKILNMANQMSALQDRLDSTSVIKSQRGSQTPKRKYNRTATPRTPRGSRTPRGGGRSALNNTHYSISQDNPELPQTSFQTQSSPARKTTNHKRGGITTPQVPQNRYIQQHQPQQPQMGMPSQRSLAQQQSLVQNQPIPSQPMQTTPVQANSLQAQPIPVHQPVPTQQSIQTSQPSQLQPVLLSTQPQAQPASQPQYIINPHSQIHHQHHQQTALPPYVPSSQIQQIIENTPVSDEYADSIRMLVLLANGEQRLITFTLPKEQCSIQEILEQVGVPLQPDTRIECTETNTNGINYIVTVGLMQYSSTSEQSFDENVESEDSIVSIPKPSITEGPPRAPTPEPPKEVPKVVPGRLAVCVNCGYLSEDFNKCLRCKRKLPDVVKSVPASDQLISKKPEPMKPQSLLQDKKAAITTATKTNGTTKAMTTATSTLRKKGKSKLVEPEPIILTLSSDEEDDSSSKSTSYTPVKSAEPHLTLADVKKEPSLIDIQECDKELISEGIRGGGKEENVPNLSTTVYCRTIRIGSYRFVPPDDILIDNKGVTIKVPMPKDQDEIKTITIERHKIVKVLANFQKMLPVIFYYVMPSVGELIRDQLNMVHGSEPYFDPLSKEEAFKRITVLPEIIADDAKSVFKQIYSRPNIIDELTAKEANNILLKTCPKEVTKAIGVASCFTEIKQLLIYPPGKGGLSINTEDYLCLAQDQFLNDVIIDFYLKYVVLNLPKEQQEKVHVFSTFFYKRLTTKPLKASRRAHPSEVDSTLTAAQKRHARVKNWTKHVNLFQKDFIIIPINESCHWFLAIICFPGLDGCYTFDGKPVKLEPKTKKKKPLTTTVGNVTITQVKLEKLESIPDDGEASDKDEAEGDDSELDSEEEVEEPPKPNNLEIKQPCILIFDSLAGASRSRVVATLRDYLTCEYKIKMNSDRIFNKDLIKCGCLKVPQQTNFTDCGLYLLQYVESFFSDPIKDYRLPILQLKTWFDEITVTRKREDISNLIKDLMVKYDKDPNMLPDIAFPTMNGKLVTRTEDEDELDEEEEDMEDEDEEDMFEDELEAREMSMEAETMQSESLENDTSRCSETGEDENSDSLKSSEEMADLPIKPSVESELHNDSFEQTVAVVKPDLSEVKKETNRDTLSYLKAKRINRHKNAVQCSSTKKFKSSMF